MTNRNPYSPHTAADRAAMLARIGVKSVDDLFGAIPRDARAPGLGIGPGMSEQEVQAHLEKLAAMNRNAGSGPFFIGGPIQRRYIPAAVPVNSPDCPPRRKTSWPVLKSQSRIVRSAPAEARYRPSGGRNATLKT